MKIQNTTNWNTTDLRRLLLAGMKQFLQPDDWRYKQMCIIVKNRKTLGGRSWLNGAKIKLFLREEFDPIQLAWLIAHELEHTIGLNHKDIKGNFFAHWKSSEELLGSDLMI